MYPLDGGSCSEWCADLVVGRALDLSRAILVVVRK